MGPKRANRPACRPARAFSLVELIIVVTIISIIAAIAVPRMTAASGKASANALEATLANIRQAIDRYYAEHGEYPGYDPASGDSDGDFFVDQLLKHSNHKGDVSDTYSATYRYGPYLRDPFPMNPTNELDTVHVKAKLANPSPADGTFGWIAVLSHGYFAISATDADLNAIGVEKVDARAKMRLLD